MSLDSILRSTGKNLLNSDNISLGQFCTVVSKGNGGAVITSPNNEENIATIAYLLNRVKLPAGTYTFSCNFTVENTKNTTRPNEIMIFVDRTFKQTWNLAKSDGTYAPTITFTIDKESEISISWYFNVGAYTTADTTAKVTFSNLQLEKGSTSTSYEPYQQGPKSINIKKNLLSVMSLYPTVTNNAIPIYFKAGQTYTLSMTSTYEQYRIMLFGTDINGTAFDATSQDVDKYIQGMYTGNTGRLQNSGNQTAKTLSLKCNTDCIITAIVFWNAANESGKTYSNVQLETNPQASPYIPYNAEVLKVSYGSRNLWQNTNTTFPAALSYNSDTQTYTMSTGTAGYNFVAHTLTNPIPAGTTVTISIMFQSGKGKSVSIGGYHRTGGRSWQGFIDVPFNVDMTGQTLTSTFTTTETVEEFMVFHNTGDNIEEPFVFKVQYELGDKATGYVPYSREVVWTQPVLTGYNITSTTNDDGTQTLNIVDATSTTDRYNITSTDNSDGTQTLNVTDV